MVHTNTDELMEAIKLSVLNEGLLRLCPRSYKFNGVWHTVSQSEYDAILRSGPPHRFDSYSSDPTMPRMVRGAIWCMANRPGQTEPGASPIYEDYSTDMARLRRLAGSKYKRSYTAWTFADDVMLMSLRNHRMGGGYAWWQIAEKMKRSEGACKMRMKQIEKRP